MLSKKLITKAYVPMLRAVAPFRENHHLYFSSNIPVYKFSDIQKKTSSTQSIKDVKKETPLSETISRDFGLGHFMTRIYKSTGGAIFSSLVTAQIIASTPFAADPFLMAVGAVAAYGGVFGVNWIKPEEVQEKIEGKLLPVAKQPLSRKLAFGLLTVGMGTTMAPLVAIVQAIDPMIFPMSIGISGLIFGGVTAYSYSKRLGTFSKWGPALYGSLLGLIGLNVAGLVSLAIWGPTPVTQAFFSIEPYISILLFSGFIAYDTHRAVEFYKAGKYDHFAHAVELYLDFINILIEVMKILAKAKQKK